MRPIATSGTYRPKPMSAVTALHAEIPDRKDLPIPSSPSTTYDASGEPLMEDAHIHTMSDRDDMISAHDHNTNARFPSYPTFDDSQKMVHANDSEMSRKDIMKMAERRNKHVSNTSTNDTVPQTPTARDGSSVGSDSRASTTATVDSLPALQTKGPPNDLDKLEQVNIDDPTNFDLLESVPDQSQAIYALESRSLQLFSAEHLHMIVKDSRLLRQFTGFLNSHRPSSVRTMNYYLDALKAIRAMNYANAVARSLAPLDGPDSQQCPPTNTDTINATLLERAEAAFQELARDDLSAWVTYTWTQIVSDSIQRRVTGTLPAHLREASEGLAEVFCLSDPSRPDNPIVFASEEFQKTTGYGLTYCVGRNCRFLQGPKTDESSVHRLAQAVRAGKEHSETFINYRRDGSPFMNLLMVAPLLDSQGKIRYFIGAQVDVSGLAKDCTGLEGLQRLVDRQDDPARAAAEDAQDAKQDEFERLSEILSNHELETVRKFGGKMHQAQADEDLAADDETFDRASIVSQRPRLMLTDPTSEELDARTRRMPPAQAAAVHADIQANGRLQGVYQNYLLVRPAPSLRILFTSPSLRIPGILQSSFMARIGGSSRVRTELMHAFEEGRGVTAKVKWLTRPRDESVEAPSHGEEGRSRWLHCTPLVGHTGKIGVWMIVLIDEETRPGDAQRRFRPAPPVAATQQIQSSRNSEDRARSTMLPSGVQSKRTTASSFVRPLTVGSVGVADALKSHPVSPIRAQHPSPKRSTALPMDDGLPEDFKEFAAQRNSQGSDIAMIQHSRPQSEISFALR